MASLRSEPYDNFSDALIVRSFSYKYLIQMASPRYEYSYVHSNFDLGETLLTNIMLIWPLSSVSFLMFLQIT
jgi:hypothetical protein